MMIAFLTLAALGAKALPIYEPFVYTADTPLIGQTHPSGLTWVPAGTGSEQATNRVGNLTVPGLAGPGGGFVRVRAGSGPSARLPIGGAINSGSVYFSFAMRIPDLNGLGAGGNYIAGFTPAPGAQVTTPSNVFARVLLRSVTDGYQIGLSKASSLDTDWVWHPVTLTSNNTVFVVGHYSFNAAGQDNDLARLWVDPGSGSFGATDAPSPSLSNTAGTDANQIASIVLLQRPVPAQPAIVQVDELRLGDTWASVTPPGNQPPGISDIPDQTINEDNALGPLALTVGDAETAAAALTLSATSSNTTLVPVASVVFGGSASNRTVTVTPVLNLSGTALITVTVNDGNGGTASDSFLVTVNAVNDLPVISDVADQTINEDTAIGPLAFTVGDVETVATALTLSATSTNTTLVPVASVVFGGSASNRTVTVTPASNRSGTTLITVTVNDGTGGTASDSFLVTVNAVNDPPTISNVPDQVIAEGGSTGPLSFTVGDPDNNANTLTLTRASSNSALVPIANIVFGGNGSSRTVTITPTPDQSGIAVITLTVSDGQLSATDTVQLEVQAMGDGGSKDWGDAPDDESTPAYPTLMMNNGAYHLIDAGFCLGTLIDGEMDGQPDDDAMGDDTSGTKDEDGVTIPEPLLIGTTSTIEVFLTSVSGQQGKLNAWIDFNSDKVWQTGVEHFAVNYILNPGPNSIAVTVPDKAVTGLTYARFRLSRITLQGDVNPFGAAPLGEGETGAAGIGEVEDYLVEIQREFDLEITKSASASSVLVGDTLTYSLAVINRGPSPAEAVVVTDTLPTKVTGVSLTTSQGSCVAGAGVITCSLGGLAVGASATITITVKVTGAGTLLNCATVTGTGTETDPGDNNACVTVGASQPETNACQLSCSGTNFWLTFPGNYAFVVDPVTPRLCILGSSGTAVRIASRVFAADVVMLLPASGVTEIDLDPDVDLGNANELIEEKGIHVTASAPITVYALSKVDQSSDGYLALPNPALGTDYIVAAYQNVHTGVPELSGTQFAIVATEPDTDVTITPSYATGSHAAGGVFVINLPTRGSTYQFRNTNDAPADLTGTVIQSLSGKPIAVFGGHRIANINSTDLFFADYLVEQLLPTSRWGTEFYTAPLKTRTGYSVRILGATAGTAVTIGGSPITLTNRGDHYESSLTNGSAITSDHPVLVMQYANSSDYDGVTDADPFMVTVPAVSHFGTSVEFCTPASGFTAHYVNIIVPQSATNSVKLVPAGTSLVAHGNIGSTYAYMTMSVSSGRYTVSADQPMGVIVYGWNLYESYGWPACFSSGNTPPTLECPEDIVIEFAGGEGTIVEYSVVASDDCDSSVTVVCHPLSGTLFPVGTTVVECTGTDSAGLAARCSFTVTLNGESGGTDWGDAPESYHTSSITDGARHQIVAGWRLGERIDAEGDGIPTADALGDDLTGTAPDDEDGVRFLTSITAGKTATLEVVCSTNGKLDGWIDFNRNGTWEPREQIFPSIALAAGTNYPSFTVPASNFLAGASYSRFRFSETGGLGVKGPAPLGEVEDYAVELSINFSDQNASSIGDSTVDVVSNLLVVANIGSTGKDGVSIPLENSNVVWQASLGFVAVDGPSSVFKIEAFGDIGDASNVRLASATFSNGTGGLSLAAKFSGLVGDPSNEVAQVWLGGVLVGQIDKASPRLKLSAAAGVSLSDCGFTLVSDPYFSFGFTQPVQVTSADGSSSFLGDTLILRAGVGGVLSRSASLAVNEASAAAAASDGQRLSRIVLTAARLPRFTISHLDASGPSPRLKMVLLPNGKLEVSWLYVPLPFRLQTAARLDAPIGWQVVTPESDLLRNGRRIMRVPRSGQTRFYRLAIP